MKPWLIVGKITGTQGLRGEVRVYPYTDGAERFEELEYLYFDKELTKKYEIEMVRDKKNMVVLKFVGVNTVEAAEKLKDQELYIDRNAQGRELEDGEHYIVDLIGLKVVDDERGELGILKDVLQNTAQDLYVVTLKDCKQELLIPVVDQFVRSIDLATGVITVHLLEGMLE